MKKLNEVRSRNFSEVYLPVLKSVWHYGDKIKSRAGETRELLDFKTTLTNPYERCVGGSNRGINIFFLLAEAIWIAAGKRDVAFLDIFNSNMKNFSDNGRVFHAPYGFRLRSWGVRAEDEHIIAPPSGIDQVVNAIKMLAENPESRQVVMSIWNPEFDLGVSTKDIPCNDLVMLKIRNGKLITTIANRSNDIHWGLPTNVFQFSFLTELMAICLNVFLGTQTHNSQSLHVYEWNEITEKMFKSKEGGELYTHGGKAIPMDFFFDLDVPANRFRQIDSYLDIIIRNLTALNETGVQDEEEVMSIMKFSRWLYTAYHFLAIYIKVKRRIAYLKSDEKRDEIRIWAIKELRSRNLLGNNWDIFLLAKSFYVKKLGERPEFITEKEYELLKNL